MSLSLAICAVGPALELTTVVLLLRKALWRVYTLFFIYAVWVLIANSTLLLTWFSPIYPAVYWDIDSIDIVLRLLVVWEVFRQTFPKNSTLNRSLSKGLRIIAFGLLVLACATFLGYQNYTDLRSLHLALDRSFGFVQAIMILGMLVMARYYGVRCGRNIRGIALAFGGWVSISTANNAMVAMVNADNSLHPLFYYLRPLSYAFMLVVWVWALWVYEPNPAIKESGAADLTRWAEDWNRTISTARTMIRP